MGLDGIPLWLTISLTLLVVVVTTFILWMALRKKPAPPPIAAPPPIVPAPTVPYALPATKYPGANFAAGPSPLAGCNPPIGNIDAYGHQPAGGGDLIERDHIWSGAAVKAAVKVLVVNAAEREKRADAAAQRALTVVIPSWFHEMGETFGSKNTAARIAKDSKDPVGATLSNIKVYADLLVAFLNPSSAARKEIEERRDKVLNKLGIAHGKTLTEAEYDEMKLAVTQMNKMILKPQEYANFLTACATNPYSGTKLTAPFLHPK